MMSKLLTVVVLGLSALSFNAAFAHGGGPAGHPLCGELVVRNIELPFVVLPEEREEERSWRI